MKANIARITLPFISTGSLGAFLPEEDAIFDTDKGTFKVGKQSREGGRLADIGSPNRTIKTVVFDFTRIEIRSGITIRAQGSSPLVLLATAEAVVDGVIDVSGFDGADGAGGGGGGGGGALAIFADSVTVGRLGKIFANGGKGGRSSAINGSGTGGGPGPGGGAGGDGGATVAGGSGGKGGNGSWIGYAGGGGGGGAYSGPGGAAGSDLITSISSLIFTTFWSAGAGADAGPGVCPAVVAGGNGGSGGSIGGGLGGAGGTGAPRNGTAGGAAGILGGGGGGGGGGATVGGSGGVGGKGSLGSGGGGGGGGADGCPGTPAGRGAAGGLGGNAIFRFLIGPVLRHYGVGANPGTTPRQPNGGDGGAGLINLGALKGFVKTSGLLSAKSGSKDRSRSNKGLITIFGALKDSGKTDGYVHESPGMGVEDWIVSGGGGGGGAGAPGLSKGRRVGKK